MSKAGVVIAAAGAGRRMRSDKPKQFIELDGQPVLALTLRKFDRCPMIDHIVVAAPKDALDEVRAIVEREHLARSVSVVEGGQRRQDSTAIGLAALLPGTEIAVFHDGVRPFVRNVDIEAVVAAAAESGAAILAVPVVDTVKQVGRDVVESTVNREHLVLVQTPQAFRLDVISRAFESARRDGYYGTDESSLVERVGLPVRVVRGYEYNIKITRPADLTLARFLLSEEAHA